MSMMKAARLHKVGAPMEIEQLPIPQPAANDVQIRVRACGIVPNLGNILANWTTWFPELPLPPLPAVFGLDPAGEVTAVGSHVHAWKPGDRVYVNPSLYCGGCRACRSGDLINCTHYAFSGYFGFSENSLKLYKNYPNGGLAEYMIAPQYALVKLPDNVSFNQAARFGYLGTMYSAMRKAGIGPGKSMLVNGISGTLGIGGALFGLAMGATRILGTGRNPELLARVKALAPDRIEVFSNANGEAIDAWVKARTAGLGVDTFIDALGPGAPHETMQQGIRSLKRGGRAFNIGAIAGMVGLDLHTMMDDQQSIEGSAWFTAGEGQDIADMAEAGTLDLSVFEHVCHPLERVNEAISGIASRNGGFSNFVINP
ncbi:alcohol dehydrogenase [Variovorax sp. YR750]|uniref:alcohol dehydrogenase catalytic domain-containing protein n=1 Tax=Variovorax sp. YR750 TaxID=1884384 RepID=UPI0008D04B9E|nr:alcohol dehydrogenase catalytic domain-containing protein [Variovorax sp. YR750]SEM43069.1 alcohol dehydrogenase [Variovorax sp. YR750]